MSNENRKAYLDPQHRINIKREEIPKPGSFDVIVKVEANGICGSDIHFFNEGKLGNFVVNEPYVPGHECSGRIIEVGKEVKGLSVGDHVTIEPGIPCGRCSSCRSGRYNLCMDVVFLSAPPINGTFCDYICMPSDIVYRVPENITFAEAAMIEPTAVAVHAVNRAKFRKGAKAVVAGAGPIGLLTLQAFKAAGGGRVICTDINDNRLEFAKRLGADEVVNVGGKAAYVRGEGVSVGHKAANVVGGAVNVPGEVISANNADADLYDAAEVVFETAGSDKATASLFRYAAPGGCVVQVGWPRSNLIEMNIAQFIEKELDYVAVNRYANAYPAAIQWVCDGRINVKDLITHTFYLDDIQEAFEFTGKNPGEVIKTVVLNNN